VYKRQGYFFSKPVTADEFAELLVRAPFELPEAQAAVGMRKRS
jgi:hypothetical protein